MSARSYLFLASLVCLLVALVVSVMSENVAYAVVSGVGAVIVLIALIRMDRSR